MKLATLRGAALLAMMATLGTVQDTAVAADNAEFIDLRTAGVVTGGDPEAGAAKAVSCESCHGPAGHSMVPTFPSLAGQPQTYLYLELLEYKNGSRSDPAMSPQMQDLSEQDILNLSAYFASQTVESPTASSAAAPADLLSRGRQVYQHGDPQQGIPPCQGCHGPDGRGPQPKMTSARTPWHTFPALAGQQAGYLLSQLQAFKSGERGDDSNARIMESVVQNLDEHTMQSLATYVSSVLPADPD